MRIFNFGSINIDKVYRVENIVKEGETITASLLSVNMGGKGLNQSISLARSNSSVIHAGALGNDGAFIEDYLLDNGVDTSLLSHPNTETGHAIIQVNDEGQNAIVIYGGANQTLSQSYIDSVLNRAKEADAVLLQNETSNVRYIIESAHKRGLKVIWNPSPFPSDISSYPLDDVDIFFVNEIEGASLLGKEDYEEELIKGLKEKFSSKMIVLTLGENGSKCIKDGKVYRMDIERVKVVDTTGAGDTFTGFFLSKYFSDGDIEKALRYATVASALAVSREGAAKAIPTIEEVEEFIEERKNVGGLSYLKK